MSRYRVRRAKWEAPAAPPQAARAAGEHNAPAPQLPQNRTPVAPQVPKNTTPAAPPIEARGHKQYEERALPIIAPHAARPTRPERVPIPAYPIAVKPNPAAGTVQKAPRAPSGERKRQAEQSKGNNEKGSKERQNQ